MVWGLGQHFVALGLVGVVDCLVGWVLLFVSGAVCECFGDLTLFVGVPIVGLWRELLDLGWVWVGLCSTRVRLVLRINLVRLSRSRVCTSLPRRGFWVVCLFLFFLLFSFVFLVV